MLFSPQADSGYCIKAYLIPESPSAHPSLNFFSNGQLRGTVQANTFSDAVADRHNTGMVCFIVDESMIEGLSGFSELEVRDADSGILVHRRPGVPTLTQSVFRMETHLFPIWRLDNAFKPYFTFWYDRIDQHSAETAAQVLLYYRFCSLYSSGRILLENFDHHIFPHQKTAVILHDPYDELAERLLVFKRLGCDANLLLNDRDAMIFAPLLEIANQLKTFDERELRRVLGKVDLQTLSLLSDPVTRQFVCSTPNEPPPRGAVSKTLKILSEFDVVGIRRRGRMFSAALAELVGLPQITMPEIEPIPGLRQVSRDLRAIRWIEGLIEHDLEVYQSVEEAFAKAS